MFKVVGNKLYMNNCLYFYPERFCLLRTYSDHNIAVQAGKKIAKEHNEEIIIEQEPVIKAMMERDA